MKTLFMFLVRLVGYTGALALFAWPVHLLIFDYEWYSAYLLYSVFGTLLAVVASGADKQQVGTRGRVQVDDTDPEVFEDLPVDERDPLVDTADPLNTWTVEFRNPNNALR